MASPHSTSSPSPSPQSSQSDEAVSVERFNRRLGLALFALYTTAYAVFMALAAFFPEVMALRPSGGVNVAISYGFGLIFGAFVLALVYLLLAKKVGAP